MDQAEIARNEAKSVEQRFKNIMMKEFNQAPRIAEAIYEEAQDCLQGTSQNLRPGQVRQIVLRRDTVHGQSLCKSETVEVTLTIDAGRADAEIKQSQGAVALRRIRLQRLLEETLNQGGVATQEDLARSLQVSIRTIKRDCAFLKEQGIIVPTRGKLKGIGRGQTHKAQIVGRWLRGETYDQIARHTHHSPHCIKRYVQTFTRVINLRQKGLNNTEISLLLQISLPLVDDYVAIYTQNDTPFCRHRLQEQLERITRFNNTQKKRGML